MRISVIGLGKLGAPLAAVLADHGHDVTAVDREQAVVDLLNEGSTRVDEPGLTGLIERNRSRLRGSTDAAVAAAATDVTFIIVPTPTTSTGTFGLDAVEHAVTGVGRGLRGRSAYHVVVVTSTVAPGAMDDVIRPALERASGRQVGRGLGLCYNPEFVALGSVIRDMCEPDLVLIGESDERAGDVVESIHRGIAGAAPAVHRMNFVNAEVAKLAVNTFVTTKISYANMLAELCERLPGGDVHVVTRAIGADGRIGHRFFTGALGYGGPCFPRDNVAFAAVASRHGAGAELAVATDAINRRQVERLAALVRAQLGSDRKVGILGLSYKPETAVVDESQAMMLANHLAGAGLQVTVFDPAAGESARGQLHGAVTIAVSAAACIARATVLVLAVPWPEFREVPDLVARCATPPQAIVDCWRQLDVDRCPGVDVVYIGRGPVERPLAAAATADAHER